MSNYNPSDYTLPSTANPLPSRRKQPAVTTTPATGGYPNTTANTQTTKTRGNGAATKGTGFNNKGC